MNYIILLASLINSECAQCDSVEKLLIGSVVINRSIERNKNIKEIIFEPHQFHGVTNKQFFPSWESQKAAAYLLMHGSINTEIKYFYLRQSPHKKWRSRLKVVVKSKYHNFCK